MFRLYSSDQVGQILAGRRKALGLTQADVASRLGISQNRWSELENNPHQITLDRLLALSGILGVEWLIQDRDSIPKTSSEW